MAHNVTLIPGDSVGRELAPMTQRVIAAAGVDVDWDVVEAGTNPFGQSGDPLPPEVFDSIARTGVALKGELKTPQGSGYESPNVRLRKRLDLFATVRPIKVQPGLPGRYDKVDVVVVREATEDVYAGIEHVVVPGVVQSIKVTTKKASDRIIRFAFEYARAHGRKKVTLVHKANIMKKADGLFLACGNAIAGEYADVAYESIIADNACMQLVRDPSRYDVLVTQNLFGDLLGDLGAGLVGGMSNVWGELRNEGGTAVFEAIHGIADALVGTGRANPLPYLRPATALLRHLGEASAADRVDAAIAAAVTAGHKTPDIGGVSTTTEMVDAIIRHLD
ncbi:MAG: NAD-dependent isocitrate dehydrogenase [Myxococcales bacterium]|nr:NAD-dependent isocitrate dehydrogenase [Myxococcales bacterium]MCB9730999.1 NAD-dependent isocitrate dehydrogenase [Deltaproteobacteria bacterium]